MARESGAVVVTLLLCSWLLSLVSGQSAKSPPTFVAFSVGKTKHQLGEGRVIYEKVFLNIGNGWNAKQRAFIAPAGGVYQITFSALNYILDGESRELRLSLYKNEESLITVFGPDSVYGQASNTILLQLLPGDLVFIRATKKENGLFGSSTSVFCTFSGHLIVPIYQVTTYIAGVFDTDPQFRRQT